MYVKIENDGIVAESGLPPYPWSEVPVVEQEYAGWFKVDESALEQVDDATHRVASTQVVIQSGRPVLAVTVEAKPIEDIQAAFVLEAEIEIQKRLNDWAAERRYGTPTTEPIVSLCTYVTSSNPQFAAEGQRGVDLRDATWAKCYEIMGEVLTGQRPMPTLDEVLAELPELTWTA